MSTTEVTSTTVRFAAMNLLTMREHSKKELSEKLSKKYPHCDFIESVINQLIQDGLQSDSRFAEAFIGMRKRQGKGMLIITMELKERGVSSDIINNLLESDDKSWKLLAVSVRQKKFGQHAPLDMKDKAKQMRFLSTRGFTSGCIQYALKHAGNFIEQ